MKNAYFETGFVDTMDWTEWEQQEDRIREQEEEQEE